MASRATAVPDEQVRRIAISIAVTKLPNNALVSDLAFERQHASPIRKNHVVTRRLRGTVPLRERNNFFVVGVGCQVSTGRGIIWAAVAVAVAFVAWLIVDGPSPSR